MHQEDEEYDDDDNNSQDKYKNYFKFDPDAWDAWGKALYDTLNNMSNNFTNTWYVYGFPPKSFPVNSLTSNTGKDKNPVQYLGVNYQNQPIWKKKYFVNDPLSTEYVNHIKSHAVHFLQQPHYYKGMFDILN